MCSYCVTHLPGENIVDDAFACCDDSGVVLNTTDFVSLDEKGNGSAGATPSTRASSFLLVVVHDALVMRARRIR